MACGPAAQTRKTRKTGSPPDGGEILQNLIQNSSKSFCLILGAILFNLAFGLPPSHLGHSSEFDGSRFGVGSAPRGTPTLVRDMARSNCFLGFSFVLVVIP